MIYVVRKTVMIVKYICEWRLDFLAKICLTRLYYLARVFLSIIFLNVFFFHACQSHERLSEKNTFNQLSIVSVHVRTHVAKMPLILVWIQLLEESIFGRNITPRNKPSICNVNWAPSWKGHVPCRKRLAYVSRFKQSPHILFILFIRCV